MPKLTKSTPRYRKHKATGQAVVVLDGKTFYLGPHGTKASKLQYDQLIGEWLANGRHLPAQQGEILTVTKLAATYLKFAKGYYVKNGKTTDELGCVKVALRHLRLTYGNVPVTEFGPLSLMSLQDRMIEHGNCRSYINSQIGRIKRVFRWGVARELAPVSVYESLRAVAGLRKGKTKARESKPILPVDNATIETTIKYLPNPVIADMIRFQRLTGCRPGELMSIRPRDIDREYQIGIWLYYPESHKMEHKDRHRVIVIGPQAQSVLSKYLLREEDEHCFLRRNRQPFERWHYAQRIKYACKKAGVEPWAPNRLRHAAATQIRKLHGLEAAQVVAGHAQANVTQIYAERDLEKAIEIMREVG